MSEIIFEHVKMQFGERVVLSDVTARIPLRDITFIVGKSGQGKSVLCRLAVGLLKPTAGSVVVDGLPVHTLPERKLQPLRARVPYLVQGPALLDWLSLVDNVALAKEGALASGAAMHAMERVGLTEFAKRFPPEVGPGVRKRAAIARALVLGPQYLLLDEPTTGLDREAASQVNDALAEVRKQGVGCAVVSHDYDSLIRLAEHVLEIDQGRAGFQGDRAAFISTELFARNSRGARHAIR